jgi:hypothetical protein
MPTPTTSTQQPAPSIAEALAAKIARIEALHVENQADRFPSFQARLVAAAADQPRDAAERMRDDRWPR